MRESGELDTVFFTKQALLMTTFLDVIDLDGLVASRCHEELTFVVVIDG